MDVPSLTDSKAQNLIAGQRGKSRGRALKMPRGGKRVPPRSKIFLGVVSRTRFLFWSTGFDFLGGRRKITRRERRKEPKSPPETSGDRDSSESEDGDDPAPSNAHHRSGSEVDNGDSGIDHLREKPRSSLRDFQIWLNIESPEGFPG